MDRNWRRDTEISLGGQWNLDGLDGVYKCFLIRWFLEDSGGGTVCDNVTEGMKGNRQKKEYAVVMGLALDGIWNGL